MNNQIGTDFAEVQQTVSQMNAELQKMSEELKKMINLVQQQDDWRGPDAAKYKAAIMDFISKIANTIGWMEKLDNTIASHSQALYERSVEAAKNVRAGIE